MSRIKDAAEDQYQHVLEQANQLQSHREVGATLGIGRARVFYQEQVALKKMRSALSSQGICCRSDFEAVPALRIEEYTEQLPAPEVERFSPLHGWLRVNRIISLNAGCIEAPEVAESFKLLKLAHEDLLRPPLLVATPSGLVGPYRIEAAGVHSAMLFVRCWPTASAPRTVAALTPFPCTAIVESIFDTDERGDFDVPLIDCVIVSAREAKGLEL
jgi:hypothetical protein